MDRPAIDGSMVVESGDASIAMASLSTGFTLTGSSFLPPFLIFWRKLATKSIVSLALSSLNMLTALNDSNDDELLSLPIPAKSNMDESRLSMAKLDDGVTCDGSGAEKSNDFGVGGFGILLTNGSCCSN